MITPKRAPYSTTTASVENSISKINNLLLKYGISDYQWTTVWSEQIVSLKFKIEMPTGKRYMIMMNPPPFHKKKKVFDISGTKYKLQDELNWAASLRFLFNRLKTKLEGIAYGAVDVEQELLSDIVVRDTQTGSETTLGQMLKSAIQKGISADGSIDLKKALPQSDEKEEKE